ncbi:hypothetical protein D3C80_1545180 [compost metagenome]
MQGGPEKALGGVVDAIGCLVRRIVGAAQVQRGMYQCVVRGNAGVDGEELGMACGAIAERFVAGGIERSRWIGDKFFHG